MTQGTHPPHAPHSPRCPSTPAPPVLTAAAWNPQPAHRRTGLPHWPRWLRAIDERQRTKVLIRLSAALFMALPGTALACFVAVHWRVAAMLAVLLFVVPHAVLHALSAWRQSCPAELPAWLHRLDRSAPALMLAAPLTALAAHTAERWPYLPAALLAWSAGLLLTATARALPSRRPRARRALQGGAIALLLACVAVVFSGQPANVLAWLLAGIVCQLAAVVLQPIRDPPRIALVQQTLPVLASLCHFVAVALLYAVAAH